MTGREVKKSQVCQLPNIRIGGLNKNLFLTILEAREFQLKVLADPLLTEAPLSGPLAESSQVKQPEDRIHSYKARTKLLADG